MTSWNKHYRSVHQKRTARAPPEGLYNFKASGPSCTWPRNAIYLKAESCAAGAPDDCVAQGDSSVQRSDETTTEGVGCSDNAFEFDLSRKMTTWRSGGTGAGSVLLSDT